MTKVEIALIFDIENVEAEKMDYLDNIFREKVYKCDQEEYRDLCESMEAKGYYSVRLYPFCAKSEDEEDLKKALTWISDNSQLIKNIAKEDGVSIQLAIKFLVENDLMSMLGFFGGYPLELVFSPCDLQLLKDHNIDLKVTAVNFEDIDDSSDDNCDDFSNFDENEDTDCCDMSNEDFIIKSETLTEYTGIGGDVIIPKGVKNIGENAFEYYKSVTTIVIPDGVEKIGYSAFYGCSELTSVNIPDSVTLIEEAAFSGCKSLKDINIPDTVKEIQDDAFYGCESLTIHASAGSSAAQYAKENDIPFIAE